MYAIFLILLLSTIVCEGSHEREITINQKLIEQCSRDDLVWLLNLLYYSSYRSYMTIMTNQYFIDMTDDISYNSTLLMKRMRNPSCSLFVMPREIDDSGFNDIMGRAIYYYNQYVCITQLLQDKKNTLSPAAQKVRRQMTKDVRDVIVFLYNNLKDITDSIKDIFSSKEYSTRGIISNIATMIRPWVVSFTLGTSIYVSMENYLQDIFCAHTIATKKLNMIRYQFWYLIERHRIFIYDKYYSALMQWYRKTYDTPISCVVLSLQNGVVCYTFHENDILPQELNMLEVVTMSE